MNILIVGCSLNPSSHSHLLAAQAATDLAALGATPICLDLRQISLPLCDGETPCQPVESLGKAVREADAIVFAVPIYNYDVNAAAKNFVEHVGRALENKIVAFLCAAGGHGSYMSVMSMANSLMLDFRCLIVPRFVYATHQAFTGDVLTSPDTKSRIAQLCHEVVRLTKALSTTNLP